MRFYFEMCCNKPLLLYGNNTYRFDREMKNGLTRCRCTAKSYKANIIQSVLQ